ncbi:hypothetical protein BDN70DRAFT_877990 [Pholiota conissans]|uniref:Uncharacterized protein n=1 Tax=Pholiota conissans TaxID=109636 RepID=A0A9P5Z4J8_9AGAR|nr:hypothetical protein BDN70DRAFT_877990 [Pholiota conissans]
MSSEHENAPVEQTGEPTGVDHLASSQVGHSTFKTLPDLPEIPTTDLSLDFSTFIDADTPEGQKIQKRASNVMKLAQENEKLKAELKAMTDRLEAAERAAERRREQLLRKEQHIMEEPSS